MKNPVSDYYLHKLIKDFPRPSPFYIWELTNLKSSKNDRYILSYGPHQKELYLPDVHPTLAEREVILYAYAYMILKEHFPLVVMGYTQDQFISQHRSLIK